MSNYRRTTQGAVDVQFANPANMNDKQRVVVRSSPKMVGPMQRTNVRSELITNSRTPVDAGENCCGPTAYDATSVRTQISGSLENKAKVVKDVTQHIASLTAVLDDITSGFVPYEALLAILAE